MRGRLRNCELKREREIRKRNREKKIHRQDRRGLIKLCVRHPDYLWLMIEPVSVKRKGRNLLGVESTCIRVNVK